MTVEPATLPVPTVAQLLGVGRSTLYDAIKRGEIPHITIGARVLIPRWWIDWKIKPPQDYHA